MLITDSAGALAAEHGGSPWSSLIVVTCAYVIVACIRSHSYVGWIDRSRSDSRRKIAASNSVVSATTSRIVAARCSASSLALGIHERVQRTHRENGLHDPIIVSI
jgi:hypothetical protein